jgi:hypothetical protein
MAWASTVAVVVPSPATSEVLEATSLTIWAPMFSNLSFEFDLLGNGDAVLGDDRSAEGFFNQDVAAFGAEGHFNGIGQGVDAGEHFFPGLGTVFQFFCSHCLISLILEWMISFSLRLNHTKDIILAHDKKILAVQFDLGAAVFGKEHRSPTATSMATRSPASLSLPGPTATISPSAGFSLAESGMMMPPAVFSSPSSLLTKIRSFNGRIFM